MSTVIKSAEYRVDVISHKINMELEKYLSGRISDEDSSIEYTRLVNKRRNDKIEEDEETIFSVTNLEFKHSHSNAHKLGLKYEVAFMTGFYNLPEAYLNEFFSTYALTCNQIINNANTEFEHIRKIFLDEISAFDVEKLKTKPETYIDEIFEKEKAELKTSLENLAKNSKKKN
ncbi:hypothetical protein EDEG_01522 [Edhazardia aedis USNM 41457]|uniref:Uncharacterized protein n=1 Tax=Edhazardia aedis (strain USNM 41457) TaxID=1003232 RepID=J9DNS4_EDHAE|nr:hypothetical protein EDEG_01522 [Edhazardia aedis USNM 41457]|eukprot:EJW04190.1 hypothetical protein EDEG_01522 [Edhazardia aedis USNM 41457]